MSSIVPAEVLKVRSTRLWIGMTLGAAGLTALGAIATLAVAGTAQGAQAGLSPVRTVGDVRDLVYTANVAAIFAMLLGAIAITGEYRSGTIGGTFLAIPARTPVVLAKAAVSTAVGFTLGLVCGLIPLISAEGYFVVKGLPLRFGMPVAVALLAVAATAATSGAIGAGIGAALRSQLVSILGLLGWGLVVEPLIGGLLPSWKKWLPFSGAQAALAQQEPGLLRPLPGGLLLLGYVALAVALGVALTRRRDVA